MIDRLAPGLFRIDLPGSFEEQAAACRSKPPIFIRHLQPVQAELPITREAADLDSLGAAALELAPRLEAQRPFSVQTRLVGSRSGEEAKETRSSGSDSCSVSEPSSLRYPYGRFDINERLSQALIEATGAPLDVRAPEQVLSVLVTPDRGYLGVSRVEDNLSGWAGGAIRFAREPDQVSRSEFKLLEALVQFGLTLPEQGRALDLGAAPGGWTRILRRSGLDVTAVDPGDLDLRVASDPGVRHIRTTAQEYRCRRGEFQVIVNDMRMDGRDSARLMLDYAPCLAAEGLAIMTVKLPHGAPEQVAHQAIGLLLRRYTLLGARQLYHNRSEITVALRRREE